MVAPHQKEGGRAVMYFTFNNICAGYGKNEVLRDISLTINKGETVTLIGANGCGKSTLLKTVMGTVKPTSGDIYFDEKPLQSYSKKEKARRIAYLSQTHTAPPDTDVYNLVSYCLYPNMRFGRPLSSEDNSIIDETLELTGLTSLKNTPISTLSGGELQRAWIAMTVCRRPELMILDEPTTHLDIGHKIEILELLTGLKKELGLTVLSVLHDINLAARYSDRIAVLSNRNIVADGTPHEIITAKLLNSVFGVDGEIIYTNKGDPHFIPRGQTK